MRSWRNRQTQAALNRPSGKICGFKSRRAHSFTRIWLRSWLLQARKWVSSPGGQNGQLSSTQEARLRGEGRPEPHSVLSQLPQEQVRQPAVRAQAVQRRRSVPGGHVRLVREGLRRLRARRLSSRGRESELSGLAATGVGGAHVPHIGHSPGFGQAPLSTSPSVTPSFLDTRMAKASGAALRNVPDAPR